MWLVLRVSDQGSSLVCPLSAGILDAYCCSWAYVGFGQSPYAETVSMGWTPFTLIFTHMFGFRLICVFSLVRTRKDLTR